MKTYALYHGDNFIDLGSLTYLARRMNVKRNTIRYYMSPAHRRRTCDRGYIVIEIKEDEYE